MKSNIDIEELLDKYKAGNCTPEERVWVEQHFLRYMSRETKELAPQFIQKSKERSWSIIRSHISRPKNHELVWKWTPVRISVAASLILVLGVGFYLFEKLDFRNQTGKYAREKIAFNDVAPGGNKAILTLSNGESIPLNSEQQGIVVEDESILYRDGSAVRSDEPLIKDHMLTLSTPKGGQYQITLSDGTQVWLNAASRLTYPAQFSKEQREVQLEGEAYFIVNTRVNYSDLHGKREKEQLSVPFIVKSKGQIVRVLGTEFNVLSYPEDPWIKTTLVNGVVQIAEAVDYEQPKLTDFKNIRPGEQAILAQGKINIKEVNIKSETAWRNGKISLEGKNLEQILTELSRWYDIQVQYEGPIPKDTFFGRVNRSENLSSVLRLLESAQVNYRLEGRKLIVSPDHE